MLPYFKIINSDKPIEMQPEQPQKPKRNKKQTVPVHNKTHESAAAEQQPHHRNFSANFSAKRNKHHYDNVPVNQPEIVESNANVTVVTKTSRRFLAKELERISGESQELINANDHLTKKNCKLKERIGQVVGANEELTNENNVIRLQYQELINQYNALKTEFEQPKVCQDCMETNELVEQLKKDNASMRKVNVELQEDCGMLKNVVYRLNVQLERYQQKLHDRQIPLKDVQVKSESDVQATISADNLGENHYGHIHTPISWGKVNIHTLGPLLTAYQETIGEKEEIIEEYQNEMSRFTSSLKEILKENEHLHMKLNDDEACSKVLAEQLEHVRAELKSTKEQNDLLIKKCALKQDKLEEILKCYETKMEQLRRDYGVLHEQYCKSRTEIAGLKEKNKSLTDAQDDLKNERHQYIPVAVHNASVSECKRWYEELKLQYEHEKAKQQEGVELMKEQVKGLETKIAILIGEKNDLEAKLKASEKHLKKAESKVLEVEHSMHEVQLSRSACRKQLHKAMNFAKDLVCEQESLLKALNQRQQENKAVKRLGTDIASRMDLLRNQLKTVQKEAWQELSTVEERIQEQDSIITSMKEEHEQEIERLKQIIREKDQQ